MASRLYGEVSIWEFWRLFPADWPGVDMAEEHKESERGDDIRLGLGECRGEANRLLTLLVRLIVE